MSEEEERCPLISTVLELNADYIVRNTLKDIKENASEYQEEVNDYISDLEKDMVKINRASQNDNTSPEKRNLSEMKQKGSTPLHSEFEVKTPGCRKNLYYKCKNFQHFRYVYKLVYDCINRLNEICMKHNIQLENSEMQPEDKLIIKICFMGHFNDDSLKLVSKRKGKTYLRDGELWSESPSVCFATTFTDLSEAYEMKSCHSIIVQNSEHNIGYLQPKENVHFVEHDKASVRSAVTVCLENRLKTMLENSILKINDFLHTPGHSKNNSQLIEISLEMKAILKHLNVEENQTSLSSKGALEFERPDVPEKIKKFLEKEDGVSAFGIWEDGTFKIFTNKCTNAENLRERLKQIDREFFENFEIAIGNKTFRFRHNIKIEQGFVLRKRREPNKDGKIELATLGGFVKNKESTDIYGLTCNHLYQDTEEPAYTEIETVPIEIGQCIYTTRRKLCDFAVIKIHPNEIARCDISFKNDVGIQCKAKVVEKILEKHGMVHKCGSETKWTNGRIVSSPFYINEKGDQSQLFLVAGLSGSSFSERGDSGAIVFSRNTSPDQKDVDVLGMVFGDDYEDREETSDNVACQHGAETKENIPDTKLDTNKPDSDLNKEEILYRREGNAKMPDNTPNLSKENDGNLTACFPLNTAFTLLKGDKGISVEFPDVEGSLSSSSSSSSSSTSSSDTDVDNFS